MEIWLFIIILFISFITYLNFDKFKNKKSFMDKNLEMWNRCSTKKLTKFKKTINNIN
jgi:hypothetical protein